jgi:nitrogen fixation-related uncharacterized protein
MIYLLILFTLYLIIAILIALFWAKDDSFDDVEISKKELIEWIEKLKL